MRSLFYLPAIFFCTLMSCGTGSGQAFTALFDGKTFAGWEGDTIATWHIENDALVGGSLSQTVPHNDFLCTTDTFSNFHLRLQFKLTGEEGFINSGVQFHSTRLEKPAHEMKGYQADLGDGYWGSLYDESRRNKTLTVLDSAKAADAVKRNDWNDYEVISDHGHIQIFLNGLKTVDYTEPDPAIPQWGLIGLQIHGGGKAQVFFRDMRIKRLP